MTATTFLAGVLLGIVLGILAASVVFLAVRDPNLGRRPDCQPEHEEPNIVHVTYEEHA